MAAAVEMVVVETMTEMVNVSGRDTKGGGSGGGVEVEKSGVTTEKIEKTQTKRRKNSFI